MNDDNKKQDPKYGVWLPGVGWLKANSVPLAFDSKEVAESTASRIRDDATVEFIDRSLVDLENELLRAEREKIEKIKAEQEEIERQLEEKSKKNFLFRILSRKA